jgi:phage tail-like protein
MVDCGGVQGFFTSIDGLGSENEVVVSKVSNPDGKEAQLKLAGRLSWGDVTLKRGLTKDMSFWDWRQMIIEGKMKDARKNLSITLLDREYAPVIVWNLVNAWPTKIAAATLSSDSNDMQLEEVTFAHEGITREGATGGSIAK